jgi:16S rRNA (uracil1498-N3)-methyltransferase
VIPALRTSAAHVFVSSLERPELDEIDAHHLGRVLRLRDGEVVSTADGSGSWRLCRFDTRAGLVVDGETFTEPPATPALTVGFALPKGDRPEWIAQKLTELGVDAILVLHTERSIVRWEGERGQRQMDKLTRVVREAAMQSRRVRLPTVSGPAEPSSLRGDAGLDVALAEPAGGPLTLACPTVLIGPEGGWSTAELDRFPQRCDLGPNILRVETAALAAATLMSALRAAKVTFR